MRLLAGLLLVFSLAAAAHEGHVHGADLQPVAGSVAPRFEARSDLFELVGVLQGDELLVYLDRADSNAPLLQGELEIEAGNFKARAAAAADGVFRLKAGALAQPGKHALTLTIEAAGEVDLLSANFEHGMAPAAVSAPAAANSAPTPVLASVPAAAILLSAVAALVWWLRRKKSA